MPADPRGTRRLGAAGRKPRFWPDFGDFGRFSRFSARAAAGARPTTVDRYHSEASRRALRDAAGPVPIRASVLEIRAFVRCPIAKKVLKRVPKAEGRVKPSPRPSSGRDSRLFRQIRKHALANRLPDPARGRAQRFASEGHRQILFPAYVAPASAGGGWFRPFVRFSRFREPHPLYRTAQNIPLRESRKYVPEIDGGTRARPRAARPKSAMAVQSRRSDQNYKSRSSLPTNNPPRESRKTRATFLDAGERRFAGGLVLRSDGRSLGRSPVRRV